MTSVYDFTARTLQGTEIPLADFRGRVLLIANTASLCGFTPQYAGLQALQTEFEGRGFSVLGFACNQFGSQEPGSDSDIATFCSTTYGVTFPMFAKIDVNGPKAHPLFQFLTNAKRGAFGTRAVKWNFTKFLVDCGGQVTRRFAPSTKPEAIAKAITDLLGR
jgi:glutathione peroxidase